MARGAEAAEHSVGQTAERWMRRALALAECGRGRTSPNPMVGCVIVGGDRLVGEGWHERAGGPHAEIVALRAAGPRARGATAYVTLEPCTHFARTPPCVDALIAAGVRRVVAAIADPNPLAAGGAAALRAAGVEVELGVCAAEAARQNEAFLHGLAHHRPLVVLKVAVSLDGRIAAADGSSQWLTGPAARRRAHQLRAEADAVLVGSGTVLADDPRLTVRLGDPVPGPAAVPHPAVPGPAVPHLAVPHPAVPHLAVPHPVGAAAPAPAADAPDDALRPRRQPLRVVLDARGRTPAHARVLDRSAPTLICVGPDADPAPLQARGADVAVLPPGDGAGLDLDAVLAQLWSREIRSVLVEGGAGVLSAFLRARRFDRLHVHLAPLMLGSAAAPAFHAGPGTLADADRLCLEALERTGDDVLLTYRPAAPPAAPEEG